MENSEILPMNIIVRSDDGTVSILVDEICDVLDVSTDAATQPPENLPANRRALLKAVYQLESCLLLVLNTERVVSDGAD
jgi:purine-binding chemotaxis protein CheW